MVRTILVDSENVGNHWVELIDGAEYDKLMVFYTKKSGGIPYESLDQILKNKHRIEFIKCNDGINALDFQLVGELGYLLKDSSLENEWIIASNDKGYDAAINYFGQKGYQIARGNIFEIIQASKVEVKVEVLPEHVHENQAKEICSFFGKNNLNDCYTAIVGMYGQDEGIKIYQKIKKDIGCTVNIPSNEKIKRYSAIILENNETNLEIDAIDEFLISAKSKMKNLNSFRATCCNRYGKEKGEQVYNLMKPHAKIMLKL